MCYRKLNLFLEYPQLFLISTRNNTGIIIIKKRDIDQFVKISKRECRRGRRDRGRGRRCEQTGTFNQLALAKQTN